MTGPLLSVENLSVTYPGRSGETLESLRGKDAALLSHQRASGT